MQENNSSPEESTAEQVVDTAAEAIEATASVMDVNVDRLSHYIDVLGDMGLQFGSKLLMAIIVFMIGQWLIRKVMNMLDKAMSKKKVEITLRQFLHSIFKITFRAIQIIIFASMIGVETASLIAMLGAAGLAVGLALQGSLANFAGGILILFFRPFKAGDYIESQGFQGEVVEIQIFNTILLTIDNQKVIIPNSLLSNGIVKNVFCEENRRVDMIFGISYGDDIRKAKDVILQVLKADKRTLEKPAIDIWVGEHGASSINLYARPWVNSDEYWEYYFTIMEEVKLAFDREDITIPFPQRDVHLHQA